MKAKSSCDGVGTYEIKIFLSVGCKKGNNNAEIWHFLNSVSNGKKVDFCGSQYDTNVKELL
jgi:hypothetical protein